MSFTRATFASLLNKYHYKINLGDIVAGTIFSYEKFGYLVDIGIPVAAYLPKEEISIYYQQTTLNIQATTEFFILAYNIRSQQYVLSLKRLIYVRILARIRQLRYEDLILHTKVIAFNKGGLIVALEQIQGFIPNSHLVYSINKQNTLSNLIPCKFLEINDDLSRLIFSNRCAVLEIVFNELRIGKYIEVPVQDIKDYGVIVSILDLPALLHRSDMLPQTRNLLLKDLQKGMLINVRITHIDLQNGRISVVQ